MTGKQIRTIRQRTNLSRKQFAAMIGYTAASIKVFELQNKVSRFFIEAFKSAQQRYFVLLTAQIY